MRHLACDFDISKSTAYDYLHEGIDVLAGIAPDVHEALLAARARGDGHLNLGGTLIHTDRVAVVGIGIAQPILMLVPDRGKPTYVVLPDGTPKTAVGRAELRCRAHEFGSAAAAISAESWLHVPSVRAEQLPAMPIADLPRPAEVDPDARQEVIFPVKSTC